MWVSPFRYPRIRAYLQLPVAFRSLSRLSSALSAKASTLRSFQLNLLTRVRVCSLVYVYSVRRLGLGSFNVFTTNLLVTLFFNFDNNNFRCVKQLSCFLPRFGCLYLLIVLDLVFGFQGTYLSAQRTNGDGEIRTHDPLLARQVLSQLSYTPIGFSLFFCISSY